MPTPRKLTDEEARAARELRKQYKLSQRNLAQMYGVPKSAMNSLLRGLTYKNVGGPIDPGRKTPDPASPHRRSRSSAKTRETDAA